MLSTRSTSPPKSAWPGVSTMLILTPCQVIAVFFARIVIPRSRSRSLLSRMRSPARAASRKTFDCFNMPSTSVVLPWSTWAMIAMLRMSSLVVLNIRLLIGYQTTHKERPLQGVCLDDSVLSAFSHSEDRAGVCFGLVGERVEG
jgi:hypothetical protein